MGPLTIARSLAAVATVAVVLVGAGPAHAAPGIPDNLLPVYKQAAADTCGMPWTVLAAVGKVESNHGASDAPGVKSGANGSGASGPMQFLAPTWAAYGVDKDGGGANVYSPIDSVWGAAKYLCANGAGEGPERLRSALFRYNRAGWYVDKVIAQAAQYEAPDGGGLPVDDRWLDGGGVLPAIPSPTEAAGAIGDAIVGGFATAAAKAAAWMLNTVGAFVDRSTTPDVSAEWFRPPLASMRDVAVTLAVPVLILGVMQSLLRRDPAEMVRRGLLFPALAGVGMVAFMGITAMGLSVVDWMNARMIGVAGGPGKALTEMGVWFSESRTLPELATIAFSIVAMLAAGIIWIELLMRNAALFVALLFFPLGLVVLMWPAASGMARRLTTFLAALILFPFVIVAVLILASAAITGTAQLDPTPEKAGVVMAGIASLGLAAIAPYKLLGWAAMAGAAVGAAGSATTLTGRMRGAGAAVHRNGGQSDNGSAVMGAAGSTPMRVATVRPPPRQMPHALPVAPAPPPSVSTVQMVRSEVIHAGPHRGGVVIERREPAGVAGPTATMTKGTE